MNVKNKYIGSGMLKGLRFTVTKENRNELIYIWKE